MRIIELMYEHWILTLIFISSISTAIANIVEKIKGKNNEEL